MLVHCLVCHLDTRDARPKEYQDNGDEATDYDVCPVCRETPPQGRS